MNEITTLQLSELVLLRILVGGLLLFGIFRGMHRLLSLVPAQRGYRTAAHRLLPVLEASAWLFYALRSINALFTQPVYHTAAVSGLLVMLLVWISWFAVKDWTAGFVLRTQDIYEQGQNFQVGDIRGRINHVGFLAMEVEQPNGDIVKIPYSKISSQIHGRPTSETTVNDHRFQIMVPKSDSWTKVKTSLRRVILTSPWAATQREPQLRPTQETESHYIVEVTVYASNRAFAQVIEEDVRRQYPDETSESTEAYHS